MKKIILVLLGVILVGSLSAQNHKGKGQGNGNSITDTDVIKFVNKTHKIIKASFDEVKVHKVYTGGIAGAKNYQKKAIEEYGNNQNQKAINDSYTARRLAFRAFVENTGEPIPFEWKLNLKEKNLITIKLGKEKIDEILEEYKPEESDDLDIDDLDDLGGDTHKGKGQ